MIWPTVIRLGYNQPPAVKKKSKHSCDEEHELQTALHHWALWCHPRPSRTHQRGKKYPDTQYLQIMFYRRNQESFGNVKWFARQDICWGLGGKSTKQIQAHSNWATTKRGKLHSMALISPTWLLCLLLPQKEDRKVLKGWEYVQSKGNQNRQWDNDALLATSTMQRENCYLRHRGQRAAQELLMSFPPLLSH